MTQTTVIIAVGRPKTSRRWVEAFKKLQPSWKILCWDEVGSNEQADYAVVWQPPVQLFADQPQLKAVFNVGAGVDGIDFTYIPENIPVYRVEDAGMAAQMAEYAVYGALLATQRFTPYVALQQENQWQPQPPVHKEQWPVGVLGFGKIGQKVAEVLSALDYPVSAWVRSPRTEQTSVSFYAGKEQLPAFLAQSRILINVLPLTEETAGLINTQVLSQLPADSFLINMARGGHVVDEDLVAALDAKHLRGALLDVFQVEPLPEDHAYWQHPRVHLTPHIAGISLIDKTAHQIQGKIQALLAQQPASGEVKRHRMY